MASRGVEEGFKTDIEKLEGMISEMERSGLYDMAEELRVSLDSLKHDIDSLPPNYYLGKSEEFPLSTETPLNNIINKVINLEFKYGYRLSVEKLTESEILKRDTDTIESTIGENTLDVSWKELDRVYNDFVSGDRSDIETKEAKRIIASLEYKLLENEAINTENVSLYRVHDKKALVEACSKKLMDMARAEREKGSKKESELNLLARSIDENSLSDDSLWETLTGIRGIRVRLSDEDISRRVKKEESKALTVTREKEIISPYPEINGRTRFMMKMLGHDTVIKLSDGRQKTISFDKLMEMYDKHYYGEKDYLLDHIIGMVTDKDVLDTHEKSSRESSKFVALRYLKLGEGVRKVEGGMFNQCLNLEELEVGPNVELIGERAFSTTGLKKLEFRPNTKLTAISQYAFEYNKLRGLDLTKLSNLEIIGVGSFNSSIKLKAVALPKETRRIDMFSFKNSPIEEINLVPGIKTIGNEAFLGSHLKDVVLPEDIENIGNNAFASNRFLEKMEFPDGSVFLSKGRNYVGDVPLEERSQEPVKLVPDRALYKEYFDILGMGEYGPRNYKAYVTPKFLGANTEYFNSRDFQSVTIVDEKLKDDIKQKRKEALTVGYSVPRKTNGVIEDETR